MLIVSNTPFRAKLVVWKERKGKQGNRKAPYVFNFEFEHIWRMIAYDAYDSYAISSGYKNVTFKLTSS